MKGDVKFLFTITIVIIGAAILLGVFHYMGGGSGVSQTADVAKGDIEIALPYNYKNVLLDSKGFDTRTQYEDYFESPEFCEKLKNCIKTNILTNQPCVVDIVTYEGSGLDDISIKDIYPDTSQCDIENLNISLGPDSWQYACEYDGNGVTDHFDGLLGQDNGFDFDDCEFIENPVPDIDVTLYEEELPANWMTYRYQVNDYFHHYQSGSTSYYTTVGNGPGKIKIVVGKTKIMSDGTCRFSTRICPQPAIATDESSATLKIFDIFRRLEIYNQNQADLPYYIKKTELESYENYDIVDYYTWAKQTIELDQPYSITTISNAIISGFAKNPYDYHWFPHEDQGGDLHSHWSIMEGSGVNTKQINFDCGGDGICSGKITIKTYITFYYYKDDIVDDVIDGPPYIQATVYVKEV